MKMTQRLFVIALILFSTACNDDEIKMTGMAESTFIDAASKIPGRIDSIFVEEGQSVSKGQVLAKLESKELDAKLEQARGLMNAAKAKMDMAHQGAREEEKRAVKNLYLQAKEQYDYAEKTWKRFEELYSDSVISTQEKDEVEFKFNAAKQQMDAAKAKYDMAMNGARSEEKAAAEALYYQAQNGYNEALAYHQELMIKSPIDGELTKIISDAGEIVASGYPLFSIRKVSETYIVLQLKETMLNDIKIGSVMTGNIPALNKEDEFEVYYISPMADFASWRPTNQKGDFDIKTFEVRLKSKNRLSDLRPGMTVLFN